ncbi:AAA family ATPase [Robertmurraya sp. FSL R5-0851]|uniref:AAA family ATPase n=1 Tax=Robertmurraya sp. FSL R5-0851 TaxID=2921584 RepID=UPI0030FC2233
MSTFKGLMISRNHAWIEIVNQLMEEMNMEITAVPEWKRSFQDNQHYHYVLVDLDGGVYPQQLQISSTTVLIGLSSEDDFEQARNWLVGGAKDVILFPEEKQRLLDLMKVTNQQLTFQKETEAGYGAGQVHAFYSAKGGSGKTLLATMAAQSFSIHQDLKVLVIDLNAQFGNMDVLFGAQPFRSYYDLIPVMDEMDMRHLLNISTVHEETQVTFISGPVDPTKAEAIPDELITRLIRVARYNYDVVILDLPSVINNLTFTGLNEANHIHYVLTPDSLGMRAFRNASELFNRFQIGRKEELSVIVNRVHSKSELNESHIKKIIDRDVNGLVRSDFFSIQADVNMGESFFKKKKDKGTNKVTKDMKKYVDEFVKRTKG